MSVRAGRLRHRVTIRRLVASKDGTTGAVTNSWVEFAQVWAAVEPLTAKEFSDAAQTQSKVTARIVIRYMAGILPSMRVYHRNHIYKIEGVLEDRKSGIEFITLPVSEVVRG